MDAFQGDVNEYFNPMLIRMRCDVETLNNNPVLLDTKKKMAEALERGFPKLEETEEDEPICK